MLVSHSSHRLPSADKVLVLASGKVTHYGSFEEARNAGATFALASKAGQAVKPTEDIVKAYTNFPDILTEDEEDEELTWASEQAPKYAVYKLYLKCTGGWYASMLIMLVMLSNATGLGSNGYLTRNPSTDSPFCQNSLSS